MHNGDSWGCGNVPLALSIYSSLIGYMDINNSAHAHCRTASSGIIDLFITLDTSGSMRSDRFGPVLNFLLLFVRGLEISQRKTHVGLVTFNDTAQVSVHINSNTIRSQGRKNSNVEFFSIDKNLPRNPLLT